MTSVFYLPHLKQSRRWIKSFALICFFTHLSTTAAATNIKPQPTHDSSNRLSMGQKVDQLLTQDLLHAVKKLGGRSGAINVSPALFSQLDLNLPPQLKSFLIERLRTLQYFPSTKAPLRGKLVFEFNTNRKTHFSIDQCVDGKNVNLEFEIHSRVILDQVSIQEFMGRNGQTHAYLGIPTWAITGIRLLKYSDERFLGSSSTYIAHLLQGVAPYTQLAQIQWGRSGLILVCANQICSHGMEIATAIKNHSIADVSRTIFGSIFSNSSLGRPTHLATLLNYSQQSDLENNNLTFGRCSGPRK